MFGSFRVKSSINYTIPSDTIVDILEHCVVRVEWDHCEVDKRELPWDVLYFIANAILTFNGLTRIGEEKLERSLNLLKEYTINQLQDREWRGRPIPPYFSVVTVSYFAINKGVPFSKRLVIEEPYVLVRGWLTLADAEHTYYKLLDEKNKQEVGDINPPQQTIPPVHQDLSQILHDKFSLPIPPIPKK